LRSTLSIEIYPEIEPCLESFLKLHTALKKRGLNPDNVEWFADAIETGAIKVPEIQKYYAKVKDELEAIDYKKALAKYQLESVTNLMTSSTTLAFVSSSSLIE
jgi:hypothetical protein